MEKPHSQFFILINSCLSYLQRFLGVFFQILNQRRTASEPGCSEKWARVARSSFRNDVPHQRPDVVSNKKEFSHVYERVRVKKLAHEYNISLASWNISSLTSRFDVMVRRNVSILCV